MRHVKKNALQNVLLNYIQSPNFQQIISLAVFVANSFSKLSFHHLL